MGLDMYLEVKRVKETGKPKGLTGACGGLFGIAPASENEEVGYWRKFYDLDRYISELQERTEDDNCEAIELDAAQLIDIANYCAAMARDFVAENAVDDWVADDEGTWYEQRVMEWVDAATTFTQAAMDAMNGDVFYYRNWY